MENTDLINLINSCSRCSGLIVDKPCIKHGVYHRFMPPNPLILVVSESPPPGFKQDYLYNLEHRDNLRLALSKALNISERRVVEYLQSHHILWSTAIKCRPVSKDHLKKMRINCLRVLKVELKNIKPAITVALGKTAQSSFRDLGVKFDYSGYHPLYYMRMNNLGKLKTILEEATLRIKD
ncbi:MAG: uracil-DNA glycosylase family protein [Desulfurococcaceae archaeon]